MDLQKQIERILDCREGSPIRLDGEIARQPPPRPNSWQGYMEKNIPENLFEGLAAETVDRARVILHDYSSQQVAEAHSIIDILLDMYFDENVGITVAGQRLFKKDEISNNLALLASLQSYIPVFKTRNPSDPKSSAADNDSFAVYGISGETEDAVQCYLAAIALRNVFSASITSLDLQLYEKLGFNENVTFDEDDAIDDVYTELEDEYASAVTNILTWSSFAAVNLCRAVEAVTIAEAIFDSHIYRQQAEIRQQKIVENAAQTARVENAKKAAVARHRVTYDLREFAVGLLASKEYPSIMQASKAITPLVQDKARELGKPLSDERAEKTVYEWLLAGSK